jgi:hypothetical protein
MPTIPLTIVFQDGKRLYVRQAEGVPREGDHAFVMGVYYRVDAVVWQFGRDVHDGDRCIPAMPTEIHLKPAAPPADLDCTEAHPCPDGRS